MKKKIYIFRIIFYEREREREKVIEKNLFYFAMYVNHRNGYSDFNINSSSKKIN